MSEHPAPAPLTRDQEALVIVSIWIVEDALKELKKRRRLWIEPTELFSAGKIGLMASIHRHNPALGPFERFAWKRVIGAMLRANRKAKEQALFLAAATEAALEASGELVADDEPSPGSPDDVRRTLARRCDPFAVAMFVGQMSDILRRQGEEGIILRHTYRAAIAVLREGLRTLPEHQRRLWELRHFQDLSFREVASALGIDESKARRRWVKLLFALGQYLRDRGIDRWPPEEGSTVLGAEIDP